jgi:predicted membrane chloride channel (bestrophin family)
MAVSWCFICIQEIGHYIEDPFNTDMQMIPMVDITRGIKANVQGTNSVLCVY